MIRHSAFVAALFALPLAACSDRPPVPFRGSELLALGWTRPETLERPGTSAVTRLDGPAQRVGNGTARTYVLVAADNPKVPLEIGVALDEGAMEGLPGPNPHAAHAAAGSPHEHLDNHPYLLSLPLMDLAPYQFVELDWNPGGHEPPGVYDRPHFDFHFFTISPAEREAIVPSDPTYQDKADKLPPATERPTHYTTGTPPDAPVPSVPLMGVHWVDERTPELQKLFGRPEAYRPFTTTFIYGSWDGRFTFVEPMITREYLMAKKAATDPQVRDEVIDVPMAETYRPAGYFPAAYRIAYDATAKEYRVAIMKLRWRN